MLNYIHTSRFSSTSFVVSEMVSHALSRIFSPIRITDYTSAVHLEHISDLVNIASHPQFENGFLDMPVYNLIADIFCVETATSICASFSIILQS